MHHGNFLDLYPPEHRPHTQHAGRVIPKEERSRRSQRAAAAPSAPHNDDDGDDGEGCQR